MAGRLLTVVQVADELGVHKQTVYRMIWDGELSYVNVGRGSRPRIRVPRSTIDRYLDQRQRRGRAA